LPNKPFFPKKVPFLAAGITLALILGVAAALLADKMYPLPQNGIEVSEPIGTDSAAAPASAPAPMRESGMHRAGVPAEPDGLSVLSMAGGVPILSQLPRLKRLQPASIVGAILQDHLPLTIGEALDLA